MSTERNKSNDPPEDTAQDSSHISPKEEPPPVAEEKASDIDDVETLKNSTAPASPNNEKVEEPKKGLSTADDPEASRDEEPLPPPVKIPRAKRRGLFGRFTFIAEVEEPKHFDRKIKWFITFNVAFAAIAAPMGSAIIFPSLLQISSDLHTSPSITNLSAALFLLSISIAPLWWSSFAETSGRRNVYIVSFTMFIVWNVLSAVSVNIAMLIIFRMLAGGAAASAQTVGAGTIADIWEVKERGRAMGIFFLGPLCGPLIAPIIGGALTDGFGWRSTQWFLAIYGGAVLFLLTFALPETLKVTPRSEKSENVLTEESEKDKQNSSLTKTASRASQIQKASKDYLKIAHRVFVDPLKMLRYLRFPAVLITVYYASITFLCLYLLSVSLQATFSAPPYNFSTILVGLTYIPNSIGYVVASVFGGKWTDRIMAREAKRANRYDENGKLQYRPEDRMRENAWLAAFLFPAALVWYGWTAEKGVFWLVPLLANFFFGIGCMLIFGMATTMLTEFMPKKASIGVALNNFIRNIFSCVGTVVAEPLIGAIGNGWLFTGVGVIALASSVVVWAMRRYASVWRERMDRELNKRGSS